jgi:hypothetical protein
VRVTGTNLDVRAIFSTRRGCSPGRRIEDEWLTQFFAADPDWRLRFEHLALFSEGSVIKLEQIED